MCTLLVSKVDTPCFRLHPLPTFTSYHPECYGVMSQVIIDSGAENKFVDVSVLPNYLECSREVEGKTEY